MLKADLSIIITSYNKPPEQVTECVESIRQQTVSPKEIILVDDCSTQPCANGYATSILLPRNVGVARARDVGVKMSTGSLLLFVDADDKLAPDYIEQMGKTIVAFDVAYPNVLLFGEIDRNQLIESPADLKPEDLLGKTNHVLVTSMMRKSMYLDLGGFKDMPVFEDWDFWIRAMCKGYTFGKANTLLYYRQNLESRNSVSRDLKSEIIQKITSPYEVVDGKIKERKPSGTSTPKTS